MNTLRPYFLLDPDVVFLNHGSFGAVPAPVFEDYQRWQLRLERQPVLFLGRELDDLLHQSRAALGEYLHAQADDLVYIPNATHGVNIIANSLKLAPGDEVLTSDHEYGACDNAWLAVCSRTGARYIRQSIPLPVRSEDEIIEQFWGGLSPRTRVVYLSHITSPTALRLPVERIFQRARQAGLLTILDAAHSPGQMPVDLPALNADVVFGNCHKWMLSPKGAAFLFVRREVQPGIEPLVVSWGSTPTPEKSTGSRFIDILQWTGTKDPAAVLAVPAAIRFMQVHDWPAVRQASHALLRQALECICSLTGLPPAYPLEGSFFSQMAIAPLPPCTDLNLLQNRLYAEYRVEVPLTRWGAQKFVRISVQGYNTSADIDRLLAALEALLPACCT